MESAAKQVKIINPTKKIADLIRVAAYCRVSTDSQDQVNSFFAQVRYYSDYIRCNDRMTLVDIYADEGITGTSVDKRDEFKRMMKDAKNRRIDRVLVKSVTRFARNSLECLEAIRALKSYGTSVYFENDHIDTSLMNSEMILYIKSAFAQNEAMSASRRMALSTRMRMADGTYNLASAPFGYKLSDKGLVVEPQEAGIVKEIFELYLAGMGDCLILQHLKKKYGEKGWLLKRVGYILTNERYIGDCLLQKRYSPNVLPLTQKPNNGELPKYYYEGTHEPIIDKDVFEKVQAMRKERKRKYNTNGGKEKSKEFFTKKVYCRHCGWAYSKKQRNGELFWRCHKQGTTADECRTPPQSDCILRQAFVKMFNTLKQNSRTIIHETLLQLQALKMKANGGKDEIAEIDKELVTLAEQNKIYSELYAQQIMDEVSYYGHTDKLKNKMTELRSRRLKIVNDDEDENCMERVRKLERVVSDREFMTEFDEKLFNDIVERIYVEENGELTFVLQCCFELKVSMEDGL